ncbi:MAG: ABC transporter permease [Dorea sp.]|jgi:ABC-type lipoprotein release transport system permease subunit|nr:ABC transporter permease [Dorea sp.]MCI9452703.1 ABC transporter permease [Dorea sp.]
MQMILKKRILRDFKENLPRYLALGLMVILGMYIVISLVAAADTIIKGSAKAAKAQSVEDGQFSLFVPMSSAEQKKLIDAGITVEEHFYLDCKTDDDSVLRISAVRQKIDRVHADPGRLPERDGEILLEKRYSEDHRIFVGDEIGIGGRLFTVCGIGTSPDYDAPYRNLSDSIVDSRQFGTAFVNEADYQRMKEAGSSIQAEQYVYGYLLNGGLTDKELKKLLQEEIPKLTQFLPAKNNIRIKGAADDVVINKTTGLFAGVLLIGLFAYVISVFVVHTIERESEVIGTLYALGIKRKELLVHYLLLPVLLTLVSGIVGTILGYSKFGVKVQMGDTYQYFSIPDFPVAYEPYLIFYGILMPPAVAALTNLLVIYRKLQRPALALMRREQKIARGRNRDLGQMGFVHAFQIRHFLREKRTAVTVFLGMFLALLVCMLGLNCYVLCEHVRTDSVADTRYEYMYTYTLSAASPPVPSGEGITGSPDEYPLWEEILPEDGEEACGMNLKKETMGYNIDVTLLGIHPDNPYFDAPVEEGQSKILISSAMAGKFRLKPGDDLVLDDEEKDRRYAFTVDGIVPYSARMFAFMEIGSMRELIGEKENYYNIVFADHALDIEPGRLYAVSAKAEVEKSAAVFVEKMRPMVRMLMSVSALLFLVVMYLMLKVMIDRCTVPISMMKIFGYRNKEIRELYLNGNLAVVAVSAALGIPLSKVFMDAIYPYLVSNVAVGLNLTFRWWMYAGLFAAILGLYFISTLFLMRRVKRILPAEALKNRE